MSWSLQVFTLASRRLSSSKPPLLSSGPLPSCTVSHDTSLLPGGVYTGGDRGVVLASALTGLPRTTLVSMGSLSSSHWTELVITGTGSH